MLTLYTADQLLLHQRSTGLLFWKERSRSFFSSDRIHKAWNTKWSGKEAAGAGSRGYRQVSILGKRYKAHRVVWLLEYGQWPSDTLDHINGDRTDNRIDNLRCCTQADNLRNRCISTNNQSGVIGVHWEGARGKWRAQIEFQGKVYYLGRFSDKEEAVLARKTAEVHFGFHKNHGRSAL